MSELANTIHSDKGRNQGAAVVVIISDAWQLTIVAEFTERMLTDISEVLLQHVEIASAWQCFFHRHHVSCD